MALKELQIVLTGAGTSAYVGEALAPHLTAKTDLNVRAVSTTDIVSNPHGLFTKEHTQLYLFLMRAQVIALKVSLRLISQSKLLKSAIT